MIETRPTVLVVDDDAANRAVMRLACESAGHRVVETAGGADAVRLAGRGGLDLILLDVGLPDIGGLAVCRRLRASGVTIPVIIVSGHLDLVDVAAGIEAGADDYLGKPFRVRELLVRVAARLAAERTGGRPRRPRSGLMMTRSGPPGAR
jgi:DNA-binding response OmpR family regulator